MNKKVMFLMISIMISVILMSEDFVKIEIDRTKLFTQSLNDFYVARYPVTQQLFNEIMSYNNSFFEGDSLPVENINWYESIVFCNKLSIMNNLEPVYVLENERDPDRWGPIPQFRLIFWTRIEADPKANGYRLLNENEWLYLYENGVKPLINIENYYEDISEYAWIHSNSEMQTHKPGLKKPDTFGLYDLMGNVIEWRFEHNGNIGHNYFEYQNNYQRNFYNSLAYDKLNYNRFMIVRDHRGLYPMVRNSFIGMRLARNAD